jgi:hypothetical protein
VNDLHRIALVLCIALVASAAVWAAPLISVNFAHWNRDMWEPLKDVLAPTVGQMVQGPGYIENYIPPGASEKDILSCKVGSSLMMLRDFRAADLVARASLYFEGRGAPGIVVRMQRPNGAAGLTYLPLIYPDGVNLWRYDGKKWNKIAFTKTPLKIGVYHAFRVEVRGDHFTVNVDGKRLLEATDKDVLPAGEVGLWLCEGACRVKDFSVRAL